MLDPVSLPAVETEKVESLLKVCILKSPDVVIVPPVATINSGVKVISFMLEVSVFFHPSVPST